MQNRHESSGNNLWFGGSLYYTTTRMDSRTETDKNVLWVLLIHVDMWFARLTKTLDDFSVL